jgi:hypothetical protein
VKVNPARLRSLHDCDVIPVPLPDHASEQAIQPPLCFLRAGHVIAECQREHADTLDPVEMHQSLDVQGQDCGRFLVVSLKGVAALFLCGIPSFRGWFG